MWRWVLKNRWLRWIYETCGCCLFLRNGEKKYHLSALERKTPLRLNNLSREKLKWASNKMTTLWCHKVDWISNGEHRRVQVWFCSAWLHCKKEKARMLRLLLACKGWILGSAKWGKIGRGAVAQWVKSPSKVPVCCNSTGVESHDSGKDEVTCCRLSHMLSQFALV